MLLNTRKVDEANVPPKLVGSVQSYWRTSLRSTSSRSPAPLQLAGSRSSHRGIGWKLIEALGEPSRAGAAADAGMGAKSPPANIPARRKCRNFHLPTSATGAATVPAARALAKEGVPSEPWTTGILKRAPHPNAARLFPHFLLSREGQALYVRPWLSSRAPTSRRRATSRCPPRHT